MVLRHIIAACVGLVLSATASSWGFAQQYNIVGTWLTGDRSEVTIRPCRGSGYCGYVSKVVLPPKIYAEYKDELDTLNGEYLDRRNRNPALRDRPIRGLQIVTLPERTGPNSFAGELYNPEDGNTYTGKVELLSRNTLRLTGCGFFDLICRSDEWVRIAGSR